jgi:hypothetical protein
MTDQTHLNEIRARAEVATSGSWLRVTEENGGDDYVYDDDGYDDDYEDEDDTDETYVSGDVGDALRWFATENLRLGDELAAATKRAEDLKNLLTLRERKSGLWL